PSRRRMAVCVARSYAARRRDARHTAARAFARRRARGVRRSARFARHALNAMRNHNPLPRLLVIDIGGSHVKILATGESEPIRFPSGPKLTAAKMVAKVKLAAAHWQYDVVTVAYPGPVLHGRIAAEPHNLG